MKTPYFATYHGLDAMLKKFDQIEFNEPEEWWNKHSSVDIHIGDLIDMMKVHGCDNQFHGMACLSFQLTKDFHTPFCLIRGSDDNMYPEYDVLWDTFGNGFDCSLSNKNFDINEIMSIYENWLRRFLKPTDEVILELETVYPESLDNGNWRENLLNMSVGYQLSKFHEFVLKSREINAVIFLEWW